MTGSGRPTAPRWYRKGWAELNKAVRTALADPQRACFFRSVDPQGTSVCLRRYGRIRPAAFTTRHAGLNEDLLDAWLYTFSDPDISAGSDRGIL